MGQGGNNWWDRVGAMGIQNIYSRLKQSGTVVAGRDYTVSNANEEVIRKIPANQYRYTLETGDRYVRQANFQPAIGESTVWWLNTLGYGQDFFTPEDPGAANTAVVDFQNGRCVTGLTAAGAKLFHTRLIRNYAAYDRVRIIHDATLNGGTIAYDHVAGVTTAIPLDTDTVVVAVGVPWYVKVTLTNGGAVSPELRWFIVQTRVNAAPAPANAAAYMIGPNLFGVR